MTQLAPIGHSFCREATLRNLLNKDPSNYDLIRDIIADILREQTNDDDLAARIADKVGSQYEAYLTSSFEPTIRLCLALRYAIFGLIRQINDYAKVIKERKSEDDYCIPLKLLTGRVFPELDDEGLNIVTRWMLRNTRRQYPRRIVQLGVKKVFRQELIRVRKYVDRGSCFVRWMHDLFNQDNERLSPFAKIETFALGATILNQIRLQLQGSIEPSKPHTT